MTFQFGVFIIILFGMVVIDEMVRHTSFIHVIELIFFLFLLQYVRQD
jgi:hypothetical protein